MDIYQIFLDTIHTIWALVKMGIFWVVIGIGFIVSWFLASTFARNMIGKSDFLKNAWKACVLATLLVGAASGLVWYFFIQENMMEAIIIGVFTFFVPFLFMFILYKHDKAYLD